VGTDWNESGLVVVELPSVTAGVTHYVRPECFVGVTCEVGQPLRVMLSDGRSLSVRETAVEVFSKVRVAFERLAVAGLRGQRTVVVHDPPNPPQVIRYPLPVLGTDVQPYWELLPKTVNVSEGTSSVPSVSGYGRDGSGYSSIPSSRRFSPCPVPAEYGGGTAV